MYHGEHEVFRPITRAALRRYADRHGYRLIEIRHELDGLPPVWSKVPALARALETCEIATWIDGDCFIVDHTADPAAELGCCAFMAILRDSRSDICAAVLTLRSTPLARRFLADVWSRRYGDYPDWEQGAIRECMAQERYALDVALLGHEWAGLEGEGSNPDARILHGCRQTAMTVSGRAQALRERMLERVIR